MKKIIVLASAVLLAACGADEHSDLKQELNALTKDLRGHVPPLPQVKPYEPVPYTAEALVDPFLPDRIIVAQPGRATGGRGKLAPDP
ncbi:MAG TPA: pilus assembly protein PilP, partial [Burkholderiales bacterium]|nr:pilus assembly protein PilP [Burkholderiales bacterium]